MADKFADAQPKCAGLAQAYRATTQTLGCHVFDANSVTPASRVDGIHLDADQHAQLGRAMAQVVGTLLAQ